MERDFERRGRGDRVDRGFGGGRDFGGDRPMRKSFGPIPVKEGDTYDVEIEGIGDKGDGIAKVQGYVIVVPNVKKGDRVKVKVNAVRGKVSFGEVVGESQAAPEEPKPEGSNEEPAPEGGPAEDSDMGEDTGENESEEDM